MRRCGAGRPRDLPRRDQTESLALLAVRQNNHFFEIYHPVTGKPDGG
ncbi:MAG: hypothetical protein H7Z41_06360 [Cytophagales bacterium]|nr:hypothetical protein [Armatimonadota bacterium]